MDFEQANADWTFPSPTATPTTAAFGNNVFQTPKNSTFPSHFRDAFSTPQIPGYTTPQQQHQPASMTPGHRPQSSSETLRSNFYANVHAGHPPVQHTPQYKTGPPAFSPVQQQQGIHFSPPMQPGMHYPSEFTQTQTPPPTRDTSAKKPQHTEIAFGTPSTIASRRFTTPQQPANSHDSVAQQAPLHFPQLQLSPELYNFANLGPASAPVMPQSQLFWDQMGHAPATFPEQVPFEDPFAPNAMSSGFLQQAPPPPSCQPAVFQTPGMATFPVQAPQRPATAVPTSNFANTQAQQAPATTTSLDPSLIYSSPMRPIVRSSSRQNKTRQPAPAEAVASATKRKDSGFARQAPQALDAEPAFAGPGLRRNNTVGPARPKSSNSSSSASENMSRSSSFGHAPRMSSPLKRMGRAPLGSISEKKPKQRPSVVLTVDENGNARTETRQSQGSPTKSIEERYPGLFDSDTSDDESDTSEQPPSRSSSFTFAKTEDRKMKAARLDPPVENLEGIDLPRSNSRASTKGVTPSRAAISAAASLRRQGSLRRSSRTTPVKRNPMTRSASSLIDTCPMDMSGMQLQSFDSSSPTSGLDLHGKPMSTASYDHQSAAKQRQQPPRLRSTFPVQEGPSIRCVCGVPHDRGQLMVQCSSCTQFLHMPCTGLDGSRIPAGFVCFICERPRRR
ncbi:hypothetical protein D0860_04268 [Hortaea werneckii]|uniref:Zinc finger PHD-type domain-containing protein n=1 Tax=Hortaea werneckii TaxID=91943 RepID=A0A3M7H8H4_HORWE|nr:hypothetical protein D0860_04268 [Hortaea werneckii]